MDSVLNTRIGSVTKEAADVIEWKGKRVRSCRLHHAQAFKTGEVDEATGYLLPMIEERSCIAAEKNPGIDQTAVVGVRLECPSCKNHAAPH